MNDNKELIERLRDDPQWPRKPPKSYEKRYGLGVTATEVWWHKTACEAAAALEQADKRIAALRRGRDIQKGNAERWEDLAMTYKRRIEELEHSLRLLEGALLKIHRGRTATREVLTAGELRTIAREALAEKSDE